MRRVSGGREEADRDVHCCEEKKKGKGDCSSVLTREGWKVSKEDEGLTLELVDCSQIPSTSIRIEQRYSKCTNP